ncbi:hypothetical protein DPMN_045314 [Dreissena polymorpha]|uniref:Uncharacterized protein n=1 Tax=Dreissena polymorpha TaxID=45954 RepID=A0A9D4D4V3_DREPO|nr:hypothetical protein DPMN_045314 [Dreissena polymorpha]
MAGVAPKERCLRKGHYYFIGCAGIIPSLCGVVPKGEKWEECCAAVADECPPAESTSIADEYSRRVPSKTTRTIGAILTSIPVDAHWL